MNIESMTQSECYKQRVIEFNKPTPNESALNLLDARIAQFDAINKAQ